MRQYLVGVVRDGEYGVGLQRDDGVFALKIDLGTILQTSLKNLPGVLRRAIAEPVTGNLVPLRFPDTFEVWGASDTYHPGDTERPVLFHKAVGADIVGDEDLVGIRYDAVQCVPGASLGVVLNSDMQVLGFTAGNDMTCWGEEGENPLYLSQAKAYYGACVLGKRIQINPGAADYLPAQIKLKVRRRGEDIFEGETHTSRIQRPLPQLVDYLGRCKPFSNGVCLLTGSGVALPDGFSLESRDIVTVDVEGLGRLFNPVRTVDRMI